eukprot:CAMPEP_0171837574 /NCGR_PEP_ID=MMETSP0992-20121227/12261_1 /TAXON_ID=483369 /ORGANISM="non described non described, Strain CCMP2098" /LENGTH=615 /DNA_ID=CAMNT_0012453817 /DNA_START=133 /DNA_END=1981 /DNA_ORIENTATION=-
MNFKSHSSVVKGASTSLTLAVVIGCMPALQFGFAIGALNPLTAVVSQALQCSPTAFWDWPLLVSIFCPAGLGGNATRFWAHNPTSVLAAVREPLRDRARGRHLHGGGPLLPERDIPAGAPGAFRGLLQLAVGVGIFFAQLVAVPLTTADGWGWLLALPALIGAVQVAGARFVVESPEWLDLKGRTAEAATNRQTLGLVPTEPEGGGDDQNGDSSVLGAAGGGEQDGVGSIELGFRESSGDGNGNEDGDGNGDDASFSTDTLLSGLGDPATKTDATKTMATLGELWASDGGGNGGGNEGGGNGGGGGNGESPPARKGELRLPLVLLTGVLVAQQLSGINAVFFYSTDFFAAAGLSNPVLGTLLASGVNVLATAATLPLIDKMGRRPLLLWGVAGMGVSCVVITVAMVGLGAQAAAAAEQELLLSPEAMLGEMQASTSSSPFFSVLAVLGVLSFVSFFEVGLGAIPWLLGGEIFSAEAKDAAMGFASGCNWFANFGVGLFFPSLNQALGALSFLPFALVLGLTFVAAHALLPETKGRTPKEVVELMHARWRSLVGVWSSKLSGQGQDKKDHPTNYNLLPMPATASSSTTASASPSDWSSGASSSAVEAKPAATAFVY